MYVAIWVKALEIFSIYEVSPHLVLVSLNFQIQSSNVKLQNAVLGKHLQNDLGVAYWEGEKQRVD